MALLEHIASDSEVNLVPVDFVGFEQRGFSEAVAIARSDDSVAEVLGIASVGYIHQLGRPVCVRAIGGRVQNDFDRPCDLDA